MSRSIQLVIKRFMDVTLSIIGIVFLFLVPVFEIIYLSIKLTSKGPVIFKQTRIGKDKKPFVMYKFRTMIQEQYDSDGNEIMSEDRITDIGKILRKTSLDELPQLFNILNGTMSLIGPRPMLDYQAERCTLQENKRFEMRPGITGLAQVMGRNNIQWAKRIEYDIDYITNFSLALDVKVIAKTVEVVLNHKGTDIKTEYRGIDRFSKNYDPEKLDGNTNKE